MSSLLDLSNAFLSNRVVSFLPVTTSIISVIWFTKSVSLDTLILSFSLSSLSSPPPLGTASLASLVSSEVSLVSLSESIAAILAFSAASSLAFFLLYSSWLMVSSAFSFIIWASSFFLILSAFGPLGSNFIPICLANAFKISSFCFLYSSLLISASLVFSSLDISLPEVFKSCLNSSIRGWVNSGLPRVSICACSLRISL